MAQMQDRPESSKQEPSSGVAFAEDSGWPAADAAAQLARLAQMEKRAKRSAYLSAAWPLLGLIVFQVFVFGAWFFASDYLGRPLGEIWTPVMSSAVTIAMGIVLAGLLVAYAVLAGWSVKVDADLAKRLIAAEWQVNEDRAWSDHYRRHLELPRESEKKRFLRSGRVDKFETGSSADA